MYMVAITNNSNDPRLSSFDAITPNGPGDFFSPVNDNKNPNLVRGTKTLVRTLPHAQTVVNLFRRSRSMGKLTGPRRFKYKDLVQHGLNRDRFTSKFIPCVVPNWDNTPRSSYRGVVLEEATPDQFRDYLREVCAIVSNRSPEHKIIFLKSWNEWAEGNYVEPDDQFGRDYLDAIRSVILKQ